MSTDRELDVPPRDPRALDAVGAAMVPGRRRRSEISGEWPEVKSKGMVEDFRIGEEDTVEDWLGSYWEEVATSRQITTGMDLDVPCARQGVVDQNLRWGL